MKPPCHPETAPRKVRNLPKWKAALFGLSVTVLVVGIAELALRLLGYGGSPPFFKPVFEEMSRGVHSTMLRIDDGALWLYFGRRLGTDSRIIIGSTVPERVMNPKPAQICRVFLIGESTVQGFPFPPNLCAAAFLEKYLQARTPSKRVEVINCGITAVASYPLRSVMAEAVKLQPDLMVIYAGHNEYFGAFGVASAQGVGSRPWQMGLSHFGRTTAVFQAVYLALDRMRQKAPAAPGPDADPGLMSRMAAVEQIAPGGTLRRRAEASLESNISAMLAMARKAGVPVMLCSLTANERDLPPVRSIEPENPEWRALHKSAMDSFSSGPQTAQRLLLRALEMEPDHAGTHFYLARTLELEGRTSEALRHFRMARDLDAMPWRATSRFNALLKRCADRHGVPFCDVDAVFHEEAGGAPGWDLFADHLHPSLRGQALLARAILDAVVRENLLPLAAKPPDDWRLVAKILGDNPLNRYYSANLMAGLFRRPPLDGDAASSRHWERELRARLAECKPWERRAVSRLETFLKSGRPLPSLSFMGGEEGMSDGQFADAAEYFGAAYNQARRFSEERVQAAHALFYAALRADKFTSATRNSTVRAFAEAQYVERIGVRDRARLEFALAGLASLLGEDERAKAWAARLAPDSEAAVQLEAEMREIRKTRQKTTQPTSPPTP